MAESWTTLKVLDWTTGRFERAGMDSPRLDAQVLLAHALSCDRVALYTDFDRPLSEQELGRYRALVRRRLEREPVAYLVGQQEFWSLPFGVDPRVLIPRRDTETLIQVALDAVDDKSAPLRCADIATGSGVVAITLTKELINARFVATDKSTDALEVAKANAERNEVAQRIEFRCGDLLMPLSPDGSLGLVVANLPYIASREFDELSPEVLREPRAALDGGQDGLELLRPLVQTIGAYLAKDALVTWERGAEQGTVVRALATEAGFDGAGVRTHQDLAGRDRVTSFRKS